MIGVRLKRDGLAGDFQSQVKPKFVLPCFLHRTH